MTPVAVSAVILGGLMAEAPRCTDRCTDRANIPTVEIGGAIRLPLAEPKHAVTGGSNERLSGDNYDAGYGLILRPRRIFPAANRMINAFPKPDRSTKRIGRTSSCST